MAQIVPVYYRQQVLTSIKNQLQLSNLSEAQRRLISDLDMVKELENLEEKCYNQFQMDVKAYHASVLQGTQAIWSRVGQLVSGGPLCQSYESVLSVHNSLLTHS